LRVKLSTDRFQLGNLRFGKPPSQRRSVVRQGLHLLDDGLVGFSGLQSQVCGQQKIAAKAFCNLHHVSAMTQIVYIFLQR